MDNYYVDKPVWMVDLGKSTNVNGFNEIDRTLNNQRLNKSTKYEENNNPVACADLPSP